MREKVIEFGIVARLPQGQKSPLKYADFYRRAGATAEAAVRSILLGRHVLSNYETFKVGKIPSYAEPRFPFSRAPFLFPTPIALGAEVWNIELLFCRVIIAQEETLFYPFREKRILKITLVFARKIVWNLLDSGKTSFSREENVHFRESRRGLCRISYTSLSRWGTNFLNMAFIWLSLVFIWKRVCHCSTFRFGAEYIIQIYFR